MAFFKVLLFAGLVSTIAAQQLLLRQQPDYDASEAKYSFSYHVDDPTTGDQKAQEEVRDGDTVHGYYTVAEPDGSLRRVDYTADEINGFQAVVTKQEAGAHPIQPVRSAIVAQPAVHVVQPTISTRVVQPVAQVYHAPAPVAQVYHAPAPVVHAPVLTSVPQYVTRTLAQPFAY